MIASPEATSTYFARWESGCGQSACASVTVTVSTAPEAPVSVSADRSGFCADDAGTISLSAAGGGGDTLRWYSGVCGGASIGSGNPLTIESPSGATTYFAAWENACGLSACVSTVVEVEPAPAIASVVLSGSSPYTQGSSVSVIVTLASPAGNQGATIAVTSSAFAQATISVAPNALSGSESVILANVGSSQFASAIAMSCSIGAASSASFDVVGLAAILYVSAAGDDSNDGLAPATSLRNIQTAIHRLVPGGLVIIADGIYSESLVVDRSLTLSGAGAAGTVVDAADLDRVVHVLASLVVEFRDLTLRNGTAASGGGLRTEAGSVATVRRCEIIECVAATDGGGIESFGSLSLIDSTIALNTADRGSGVHSAGTLIVSNSTVTGNSGPAHAVFIQSGSASIGFSTIAENAGSNIGINGSASLALGSSIVADAATGVDISGTITSNGFNLVENPAGSSGLGVTDQVGVDPMLSSLTQNGGPTRTLAIASGSPAIDAGDPACSLTADQRGNPRPVDGNGDGSAGCDAGAFEADGPTCAWSVGGCPGDFDGDGDFDSDDVVAFFADWENGGGCADADVDGDTDSDDIVVFFAGWENGGC